MRTELLIAEADTLWDFVLSVINELDGLAKGQETDHRAGGYARVVQEKARKSIEFLERRFESRDTCLRALTSRGNELESIAFRSEDITGQLVRPAAVKGEPIATLRTGCQELGQLRQPRQLGGRQLLSRPQRGSFLSPRSPLAQLGLAKQGQNM